MTNSGNLQQQLDAYQTALHHAQSPHIFGLLSMCGMDKAYIAGRTQMLQEVIAIAQKKEEIDQERHAVGNQLKASVVEVVSDLEATVEAMEQLGPNFAPYLKRLGIDQHLPTGFQTQISFAAAFYQELFIDSELLLKVCKGSLSEAQLRARHTKVKEVRKQELKLVELAVAVKQHTMDGNIKLGILDELMEEFKVRAKKALSTKPEYLAELGIGGDSDSYSLSA